MFKKLILSLSLLITLGFGVNIDNGVIAFSKGDYKTAFTIFEEFAKKGDKEAQAVLGTMYSNGQGVKQDYKKAIEWFEKTAAQGFAQAQLNVGMMYKEGLGVEKNYNKAFELFEKAANQNQKRALLELGDSYMLGQGVEKNLKKAFELYEKAANQGDADAQLNVGIMYKVGSGVEKNLKKAIEWYEKACNGGIQLGCDELKKLNTPISEEERMKSLNIDFDKLQNFTDKYSSEANKQYVLGGRYRYGLEVEKDYKKAIEWYEKAANQGHRKAQLEIATLYTDKENTEKDYKKAIEWYEKIINQEFTEDSTFNGDYNEYKAQKTIAQNNLGNLYYNGHGVKQDKNKAKELYEKACNGGNFISCESLKDLK